jgi:hypothetical protein
MDPERRGIVASHSGLRRECHALLYEGAHVLFYGGAQARIFTKERTAPIRWRVEHDVGDKFRRYSKEVESSRVPWLLLAVLASFA